MTRFLYGKLVFGILLRLVENWQANKISFTMKVVFIGDKVIAFRWANLFFTSNLI